MASCVAKLPPGIARKAPRSPKPLPLIVKGSAAKVMPLPMPSVAPLATVVPALVVPKADAWLATKVPSLMLVAPL